LAFETFIARRYLLSKKKVQFITIITLISIIGVMVGVAALIAVLAVFNGFNKYQINILTGFDPHVRIEQSGGGFIEDYNKVIDEVNRTVQPKAVAPFTLNKGILSTSKYNLVGFIKGVDEKKIGDLSDVKQKTWLGEFEFKDDDEIGGIVLGGGISARLLARVGDTVTIMSTAGMEKALTQIVQPKSMRFIVRGIFNSNNREYDKLYSFVSLSKSQNLFELGKGVNGVEIRLNDINKSDEAKEKLDAALGKNFNINTWYNLHEDLYSIMKVERWTAFTILSLIIAVASFSIVGSLTMTVIEKRRDIGILKAMGTTNNSIIRIFMFEGVLIGVYGTILGLILGFGVCMLQIKFKLFPLDPLVYTIDALPIDLRVTDFINISLCAMGLSFIASLYPALRAARQEPIKAIRWE
jgi:lipoprotein-releasing system permease protein